MPGRKGLRSVTLVAGLSQPLRPCLAGRRRSAQERARRPGPEPTREAGGKRSHRDHQHVPHLDGAGGRPHTGSVGDTGLNAFYQVQGTRDRAQEGWETGREGLAPNPTSRQSGRSWTEAGSARVPPEEREEALPAQPRACQRHVRDCRTPHLSPVLPSTPRGPALGRLCLIYTHRFGGAGERGEQFRIRFPFARAADYYYVTAILR